MWIWSSTGALHFGIRPERETVQITGLFFVAELAPVEINATIAKRNVNYCS